MNEEIVQHPKPRWLLLSAKLLGILGACFALKPLLASWLPSAKVRATGLPVEVDLKKIQPGQQYTVNWQGKPVWVLRRTQAMLADLDQHPDALRDPVSANSEQPGYAKNSYRSLRPEYVVLVGMCTHLGCIPQYQAAPKSTTPARFYCPCHGSTFDLAGRVLKGAPAPINLTVPPHYFKSDTVLVIGQDKA